MPYTSSALMVPLWWHSTQIQPCSLTRRAGTLCVSNDTTHVCTQFAAAVVQPLASRASQHSSAHILLQTLQVKADGPTVVIHPEPASLPLHASPDEEAIGRCEQALAAWMHTAREAVYARQASTPEGDGCVAMLRHSRTHTSMLRALDDALTAPPATAAMALVEQHSHDTALVQAAQV